MDSGTGDSASPDAVQQFLVRTFGALEETVPALRSLMAHAQRDPAFRTLFRDRFITPRRASLRALLERGRAAGNLPSSLDLDAAVSALHGGLWYRLLLDEPLDAAYATALTSLLTGP